MAEEFDPFVAGGYMSAPAAPVAQPEAKPFDPFVAGGYLSSAPPAPAKPAGSSMPNPIAWDEYGTPIFDDPAQNATPFQCVYTHQSRREVLKFKTILMIEGRAHG